MISNEYGVETRQRELLELIKQIDYEFKKYGIEYSIADGTLIGAIRYNGFIPWDDDIDIIISRKQYNKLISKAKYFENITIKRHLWTPRIQRIQEKHLRGIKIPTVDVFIGDAVPTNALVAKTKVIILKTLQGMMKEEPNYSEKPLFYKVCILITHILGKIFPNKYLYRLYRNMSKIGQNDDSKKICFYNGKFEYVGVNYSKSILERFEAHPFEDCMLPITCDYDEYLTISYGDYMTPPKESERVSEHM